MNTYDASLTYRKPGVVGADEEYFLHTRCFNHSLKMAKSSINSNY